MVKIKKSSWDSAIPNKFLNETVSCPQTHLSQWNHYVVLYLKRSRELSRHIIWLTSSFMYAIITLLLASKLKIYMSKKKKKELKGSHYAVLLHQEVKNSKSCTDLTSLWILLFCFTLSAICSLNSQYKQKSPDTIDL